LRLIVFGATGSLGRHVVRLALAAGHKVTVFVRTPSRVAPEVRDRVRVQAGDLAERAPLELISGQDALIHCAGHVTEGNRFVELFDRVVTAVEKLPAAEQPACWFLAGAALLDLDPAGRRGLDLPKLRTTYGPHRLNFERLTRAPIDWRLLCPGPMVDEPALGVDRLRLSLDRIPVDVPAIARRLPAPLLLPLFASRIPQMIVPYADAAAVMLAHLGRGDAMTRHRVGLALPPGMRGRKPRWTARTSGRA
jgi:putative NADH-flavin reductase